MQTGERQVREDESGHIVRRHERTGMGVQVTLTAARLSLAVPMLCGLMVAREAAAQTPAGSNQPAAVAPTVNLGTIPVTASALNPDGSTAASGGMYVPSPSFGPFGATPDKDIPFSTFSIPQQVLQNQQVHTTAEALKNDPSTIALAPSVNFEAYTIRGFSVNQNYIRQDGLNVLSGFFPAVEDYDRVDVLRGATSVLYGFAAPAGIVNYHSKMPLDTPLTQVGVGYISRGQVNESLDISRRFGEDDEFGVRLNLYQDNGALPVSRTSQDQSLQSISLDWKPNPDTRVWTRFEHTSLRLSGIASGFLLAPGLVSLPKLPPPTTYVWQPWYYQFTNGGIAESGVDWSHDGWEAHLALGYSEVGLRGISEDEGTPATDLQQDGSFAVRAKSEKFTWDSLAGTASVSRVVSIGPVQQTFSANYTGSRIYERFGLAASPVIGPSSILSPIYYPPIVLPLPSSSGQQDLRLNSIVLSDRIDYGMFTILAGTVYSTYSNSSNSIPELSGSNLYQNRFTPLVTALIKPTSRLTGYFSYISALQPGSTAPVTAVNANQTLPPFVGDQYETGVKYQVTKGLELNGDVFKISQQNAVLGPDNVYSANGSQEVKGAEITYAGRLLPNLSIIGGGTLLDAQVHSSLTNLQNERRPFGVPTTRLTLYSEYGVPGIQGLTLLGGIYFTSSSIVQLTQLRSNSVVQVTSPGFVTVDVGAVYATKIGTTPITIRAYLENAFNRSYYQPNSVAPYLGSPITGKLSVTANF